MKITVNNLRRDVVPVAYVTKGKQRIKQLNDTVYLNNGDQFEIELFNPTSDKVLAKIDLDGKSLGSGIILRPGERVFLERFLDNTRKFLFETYTIDGENQDAVNAISKNGTVEVRFYNEMILQQSYPYINYGTVTYTNAPTLTVFPSYTTNTAGFGMTGVNSTLTSASINASSHTGHKKLKTVVDDNFTSKSFESIGNPNLERSLFCVTLDEVKDVETGRVEKGEHSSQSFIYDNTSFNSFYSWRSSWKILPLSQKPLMKEDLKIYCGGCGAKRKKDRHKFCPNCGTEY